MRYDPDQLETLLAIAEDGTFDAAARRLHLTPSAVSQRIRALERTVGRVVIGRTAPCTPTEAGEPLVRLGRQLRLLDAEAAGALGGTTILELAVAVNADSLATWLRHVLDAVAARGSTALRLHVEDQAYSHDLLRRGEVLAAVTSEPTPVQGCMVEPLGRLRYVPAAAPALLARHRRGAGDSAEAGTHEMRAEGREVAPDWAAMPMVVFNEKDRLQDDVLLQQGADRPAVVHRVPSTADFHEAVCRGLGWGMILQPHLAPELAAGRLFRIPGAQAIEVPLFWQHWRLESPALAALTQDVRRAAAVLG